ncbi:hypothetical protein P261_02919 [Lachnospiraceae bacterium TWA4]|nr:hypothetical protein P261_02919 [Lachnospiraceae bacterium TWA4]
MFFEIGTDSSLFDGLAISREEQLCREYLGQYPVISLSLKQVSGLNFEEAKEGLSDEIRTEIRRFYHILDKEQIEDDDRKLLSDLKNEKENLKSSIKSLSEILYRYYNKKSLS